MATDYKCEPFTSNDIEKEISTQKKQTKKIFHGKGMDIF